MVHVFEGGARTLATTLTTGTDTNGNARRYAEGSLVSTIQGAGATFNVADVPHLLSNKNPLLSI